MVIAGLNKAINESINCLSLLSMPFLSFFGYGPGLISTEPSGAELSRQTTTLLAWEEKAAGRGRGACVPACCGPSAGSSSSSS